MSRYVVRFVALAVAIALIVYGASPIASIVGVVKACEIACDICLNDFNRSKLLMLYTIAIAFSDIPLDNVERYELFHTLYIYRNGSKVLINQPYLDSSMVLNLTRFAVDIRQKISSGEIKVDAVSNSSGIYIYVNGSFFMGFEYANSGSWSLWLGPLSNKTVDSNTVVYWRELRVNYSNTIVGYILINLVRNVSTTHRVYVVTAAELSPSEDKYSYVFTLANYWFKNKTIFFGDWIILPEGAENLTQYYKAIAEGVKWLSTNVYNGTSPGYLKTKGNGDYQPTAYPQIANALTTLAENIPAELSKEVEKGYALILDVHPLLVIIEAVSSWCN